MDLESKQLLNDLVSIEDSLIIIDNLISNDFLSAEMLQVKSDANANGDVMENGDGINPSILNQPRSKSIRILFRTF